MDPSYLRASSLARSRCFSCQSVNRTRRALEKASQLADSFRFSGARLRVPYHRCASSRRRDPTNLVLMLSMGMVGSYISIYSLLPIPTKSEAFYGFPCRATRGFRLGLKERSQDFRELLWSPRSGSRDRGWLWFGWLGSNHCWLRAAASCQGYGGGRSAGGACSALSFIRKDMNRSGKLLE